VTTVLVTGAGGYIGQRLTLRLTSAGHSVRALVRRPLAWGAVDGLEQVVGDLVEEPALARQMAQGVDVAIHLAGANEVATARQPERAMADTVAAAERIATSGVGRIVYLSTIHVYGSGLSPGALVTEDTPARPAHPYAAARLACEDVFRSSGVPTLIFRLTNGVGAPVFPEVDRWSLVANELCRQGAVDGSLRLRTSGAQWRDFIALSDVDSTLVGVVQDFQPGLFNLASGTSVTVRSLADLIAETYEHLTGSRPPVEAPQDSTPAVEPYKIDVHRLGEVGVAIRTPLAAAVEETVRFCLNYQRALSCGTESP
jgi:UDP-glucose 4-epimerase